VIPNELKPMRLKRLYDVDVNLIIFVYFVEATLYSKTRKALGAIDPAHVV